MSEHTPGPWMFECEDVGTYGSNFWLESEAGEEIICESENEYQGVLIKGNDFVANARLLAAAPDMLDALKAAAHVLPLGEEYDAVVEAIAKAKGETG